jgi:hypothetical protein
MAAQIGCIRSAYLMLNRMIPQVRRKAPTYAAWETTEKRPEKINHTLPRLFMTAFTLLTPSQFLTDILNFFSKLQRYFKLYNIN